MQAGDVVVIPAGVGHKNEGASRDLLLVPVAKEGAPLAARPLRATPYEDDDGVETVRVYRLTRR